MIAIIDYQMGNLRSVQKAFEHVGHAATITSDRSELDRAEKIVLPGVGAFQDAVAELRRRDLIGPIRAAIDANKPFLGICLGLQLLFDVSYEDGQHEGLGVIPGEVVRFDLPLPPAPSQSMQRSGSDTSRQQQRGSNPAAPLDNYDTPTL